MLPLLAALLLSGDPTAAAPAATTAPPQSNFVIAPLKPKKEKKICKTDPAFDTGSHLIKRICLTQQQWDARVQGRSTDEFNASMPGNH
jgi:hypothetical protein